MPEMKHTPVPWAVQENVLEQCQGGVTTRTIFIQTKDVLIAIVGPLRSDNQDLANAEFICRAVNCHEELVELLKVLVHYWDNGTPVVPRSVLTIQARAILQKATKP